MRTDIHSPKQFNPSDYEAREPWDLRLERPRYYPGATQEAIDGAMAAWREEIARMKTEFGNGSVCDPVTLGGGRWPHSCDHCGNVAVRYVWSVLHKPTGKVICIGHECVENKLGLTVDEFRMKYIKDRAARDAAMAKNIATLEKWIQENPEAASFMADVDPATESFAFVADMRRYLKANWMLTPAQTAAILKIKAKREEFQAKKAAEAAEPQPTTPAPSGRVTVIGTILGTKVVDSDFGATTKMLVKLDDHNKVWCTVPSKLYDIREPIAKGWRIKLTATFERSKDDEHFAFGSRPTAERLIG